MLKLQALLLGIILLGSVSALVGTTGSNVEVIGETVVDGDIVVNTELNVEQSVNSTAFLTVTLSNGNTVEIKRSPSEAREKAKIELKSECEDCQITLVEVSSSGETRAAYRVEDSYRARFLFIFPITVHVSADVDAETGQVIEVNKPLVAYLSSRSSASS